MVVLWLRSGLNWLGVLLSSSNSIQLIIKLLKFLGKKKVWKLLKFSLNILNGSIDIATQIKMLKIN